MKASERFAKFVMLVLITTLVVILASGMLLAYAQGGGPADAIRGAQGSTQIAVGQRVWYAFDYNGDKSQITIRMPASPRSAVAFSVWTPADVAAWASTGKENPVGRGTSNAALGKDLFWTGNFNTRGTYYVLVEQKGNAGGSYDLQISGKGAYFPTGAVQVAAAPAAPAAAPVAQPASVAAPTTRAGTGPADALTVRGDWTTVTTGQRVWYAFQYSGDKSQIVIRMPASPKSAVAFSVWTPAQADAWSRGLKQDPVGRGSPNAAMGNDLVWSGNFNTRGTYYVLVEQKGAAAGNYSLQVSGKSVTF